jgi:catalase
LATLLSTVKSIPQRIQELQIQHFYKADRKYGQGVAERLGLKIRPCYERRPGDRGRLMPATQK